MNFRDPFDFTICTMHPFHMSKGTLCYHKMYRELLLTLETDVSRPEQPIGSPLCTSTPHLSMQSPIQIKDHNQNQNTCANTPLPPRYRRPGTTQSHAIYMQPSPTQNHIQPHAQ